MTTLYTHADAASVFASLARQARAERRRKLAGEYWVRCLIAALSALR